MTLKEREREVEIAPGIKKHYLLGHTAEERFPLRTNTTRANLFKHHKLQELQLVSGQDMSSYLNRADVRAALNIPVWTPGFQSCNDPMYSTYQCFREGSIWIYNIFLGYPDLYKILHYSGDTDGAVATLGTRRWIQA